ncbi:unnamed protein product [Cuscuta epithymum]|uniref:CCHC-type domain-containing protein n=1 Tax=Cuscuta epithymum TaxID=186058 RepID=A0AAV0F8M1_9ASTE|nr:unnamed protein product [Cuscuta epithymum]
MLKLGLTTCTFLRVTSNQERREMEGKRMATRNDPKGQASVAYLEASRAVSRAFTGRGIGHGGREGRQAASANQVGSMCNMNTRRNERRRQARRDRATSQRDMTVSQTHPWANDQGGESTLTAPASPVKKKRTSRWHTSFPYSFRPSKCSNCSKKHFGKCNEPPMCYECGSTTHMKLSCPWRRQQETSQAKEGLTVEGNHTGPTASNATSVNQGGAQARDYAMTEADARANPDSVTG